MMPDRQAGTMRQPHRWPLVQYLENRDSAANKDARLINAYAEKQPEGDYVVEKRPGMSPVQYALSGNQGRGLFDWIVPGVPFTENIIMISFTNVYAFSLLNGLQNIGTIASPVGSSVVCAFLQVPNQTSPTLLFGPGGTGGSTPAYYLAFAPLAGLTVNQINNGTYPLNTVFGFVYLNGFIYVMDIYGQIWGTLNQNDPTTWNPLSKIVAGSEADYGVALAKQMVYVVALKSFTTQFFYDAGNSPGSPLAPVPDALLNYGCLSAATLQEIDGSLFWVTNSRTNSYQVMRLENLSPKIVSTPAIDRILNGVNSTDTFYSLAFKHAGHRFYVVSCVRLNFTIVYDIDQGLWYKWTDANGNFYPISANAGTSFGQQLVQDNGGLVYILDSDYVYPNDHGQLITTDIYTPNFDAGTQRRKTLNMMYFVTDQTSGSVLQARYSDSDYKNWSNFRAIELNHERPYLDQEGTFVRRAYHFRHRCNTPFRIRTSDLQLDLGTL